MTFKTLTLLTVLIICSSCNFRRKGNRNPC
nr:venom peptide [Acharia stimulea]